MQPIRHHHFPHRSQNRFRMKLKSANIIAFMRQGHNSACSILSGNCKTLRQIFPTYPPGMILPTSKLSPRPENIFSSAITRTGVQIREKLPADSPIQRRNTPRWPVHPDKSPGLIFQPHNASQLRVIFRLHLEFPAPETK